MSLIIYMKKQSVVSAPALELPTLVTPVVTDTATDTTVPTASFTPQVGDFLAVFTVSRDGTGATPNHTVSATGFTCAFTQRAIYTADDGVAAITAACSTGIVSASASGTLVLTTSENVFQKAIIPLIVPGATTFDQKGDDGNSTGATLNVAHDVSPNASALSIACAAQNGSSGTPALSTHSVITDADGTASVLRWIVRAKLGSPPDPIAFTGLQSGVAHAGAVITLL